VLDLLLWISFRFVTHISLLINTSVILVPPSGRGMLSYQNAWRESLHVEKRRS
jgi:hypothetical protein